MNARAEKETNGHKGAGRLQVSFVLATHNRCDVLRHTLDELGQCGLDRGDYEIIVVDNASTDATPEVVADRADLLVGRQRNEGSCAKAYGVERATGRYIVFLDDDSSPRPGSVERMIQHFEADASLGAAGFSVHLPDGGMEGAALPDVFVGCGVGFRAEALRVAGNLDHGFFMQAEEYDLTFRLAVTGWKVRGFDDLHVEHRKSERGRNPAATLFYDVRNNLRVAARYLPTSHFPIYRHYWTERYRWLAERCACLDSLNRGVRAARLPCAWERFSYRSRRLSPELLERFFRWNEVEGRMRSLVATGVRRVVFAGFGKNVFAFHRGAEQVGVTVVAIGDDRFSAAERQFRGVPVVSLEKALELEAHAVVVSDMSPVHAATMRERVKRLSGCPVADWFGRSDDSDRIESGRRSVLDSTPSIADEQEVRPIIACQPS